MTPGLAFLLMLVVVGVIAFIYLKPFLNKAKGIDTFNQTKLDNFMSMLKDTIDNNKVSDAAFREHIRLILAIYEGRRYEPACDNIEQEEVKVSEDKS